MSDESTAGKAFSRAIKRFPPADVELLRNLESERITDARRRIYSKLAGRQQQIRDPEHPGQMKTTTVRPTVEQVNALLDRVIKLGRHEATVFGFDAPKRADVVAAMVGQVVSDEELDIQLARLTPEEEETFMKLSAKMMGRFVEEEPEDPPALEDKSSVETTATTVEPNGTRGPH